MLDVSRVGRTAAETLEVIEALRADGGVFLSSKESFDESDEGSLMLGLFALFAQLYSDRIATGWRAVIEARAVDGHHNGTAPLGYKRVKVETVGPSSSTTRCGSGNRRRFRALRRRTERDVDRARP